MLRWKRMQRLVSSAVDVKHDFTCRWEVVERASVKQPVKISQQGHGLDRVSIPQLQLSHKQFYENFLLIINMLQRGVGL